MATIKAVSSKAPINTAIEYVTKEEKTEQKLQSGIGCNPETAYDEMQATKEMYNKTGGRQYKHYVQSFAPGETTPEQAQAIGRELAENNKAWQGFEVLVVTHKDREHIHNHFIINSVSYEDGHKIQDGPKDLENLKKQSDELCKREGLSVIDRSKPREAEEVTTYNKDTYKILKEAEKGKAQSYVQDTAIAIIEEKQTATSREEFIENMNSRGYAVDWQDSHKNITFTDKEREAHGEKKCKVRNSTLEKYYNIDFSKEGLTHEFEENRARASRPTEEQPSLAGAVEQAKAGAIEQNSRIDGVQKELEEVRADRERASRASTGSSRSGSSRAGITPTGEQETESRDNTVERTADNIKEQPQNRSGYDAELARIRAELQAEAERAERKAESVRTEQRENLSKQSDIRTGQQEVKAGTDGNQAEASRVGADQQELKAEQSSVNRELRGSAENQRNLDREHRNLESKHTGIDANHRGLKGEQQRIVGQQRSISDRIREFGERIKEAMQQVFRRGRGR